MSQNVENSYHSKSFTTVTGDSLDPDRVLSMLPLRPYHSIVDIGCGEGYFAVPLAKYVSQGKLFASDTNKKLLEICRSKLAEVHLDNVEVIHFRGKKLPIETSSVDGALMAFTLNSTRDKYGIIAESKRFLQNGGWLAILDLYDSLDNDKVKQLGLDAGLRFVQQRDFDKNNYLILFRK